MTHSVSLCVFLPSCSLTAFTVSLGWLSCLKRKLLPVIHFSDCITWWVRIWWYFCVHNFISFDKIFNTAGQNAVHLQIVFYRPVTFVLHSSSFLSFALSFPCTTSRDMPYFQLMPLREESCCWRKNAMLCLLDVLWSKTFAQCSITTWDRQIALFMISKSSWLSCNYVLSALIFRVWLAEE